MRGIMATMMGSTVLHLPSGPTGVVGKLHPTVLFNICDSFIRRNDQQERVIGTLLGSLSSDGTVEIRNSYAVPHNESLDQVLSLPQPPPSLSFSLMTFPISY